MNKYLKKRMILILSIFFLAFIAIGNVNAIDMDDNIGNADTATIIVVDNNYVSDGGSVIFTDDSTGTFTDLNNLITTNENNIIEIHKNYTYNVNDSRDGIIISKDNLIINGNGYTIDGNCESKIFNIVGNNVTLKNIFIKGANVDYSTYAEGTTFNNITDHDKIISSCNGAAINWLGNRGKLLNSSVFDNKLTGSFYFENNTEYNMKYYVGNGAGVYWGGNNGLIEEVKFNNNTLNANVTVNNMNYTESTSNILRIVGSGSSLAVTGFNVTVAKCKFDKDNISGKSESNNVIADDNLIDLISGADYLNIDDIFFNANVLFQGNNGIITDSDFNNASLKFTGNNGQVVNSNFFNGGSSVVIWGNGKWSSLGFNGTINNTNFYDNHASTNLKINCDVGAIYWSGANGTVCYSNFTNNSAYYGSAIYWIGLEGNVYNNVFKNNTAISTEPIFEVDTNLNCHDNDIDDSNKNLNPLAVWIYDKLNVELTIKLTSDMVSNGSIIINRPNVVIDGQGYTIDAMKNTVFNIPVTNVTIKNIVIKNSDVNYKDSQGGLIIWEGSKGILQNATLADSKIRDSAGAVFWGGAFGQVNDSTFTNCKSGFVGGAIMFGGDSLNSTVSNCNFTNCTSTYGGALYNNYAENLTVINCNFRNSTASGGGGAISWKGSGIIFNSTFENSNATSIGGSFYFDSDSHDTIIDNCDFINSTAPYGGAIIYNSNAGSRNIITNSTFENCSSAKKGGAIFSNHNDTLISSCTFDNCTSANGGAIQLDKNNSNIFDCNFTDCTADLGGAIASSVGNTTVSGSNFDNCNAKEGGAIYVPQSNLIVYYSNFTNNSADIGPVISANNVSIYYSKIENSSGGTDPIFARTLNAVNVTEINSEISETFASYIRTQLLKSNIVKLDRNWNTSSGVALTDDNIIIDGDNYSVTANNTYIFDMKGSNVTLKNFKSIGSNSDDNLIKWSGQNGIMENCEILNCSVSKQVVSWDADNGQLINSNFTNSRGVQFSGKDDLISNCNFYNISSMGVYVNGSNISAYNSTFEKVQGAALGIWASSNKVLGATVENSTFINCTHPEGKGAAIRSMKGILTVNNCDFTNFNGSKLEVIHVEQGNSEFNYCNFRDSNVKNFIYNDGDNNLKMNVTRCNFNNSNVCSAAIYSTVSLVVDYCNFIEFTGANSRAVPIVCANVGGCIVNNTLFEKCHNGSIRFWGNWKPTFHITNSTFINCSGSNEGAVVFFSQAKYDVSNCTFINCSSKYSLYDNNPSEYTSSKKINLNTFLNSPISNSEKNFIINNWFGKNDVTGISNTGDYLQVNVSKNYEKLIANEWNSILDVYFTINNTDNRVDFERPIFYKIIDGNAEINDGKIYAAKVDQTIKMKLIIDNEELFVEFSVTNNTGFTELQNLIKSTKANGNLLLNNNYTYNPDDEQLINGIVIDNPITITLNGSSISGNNSAKNIFNVISDDVVLENMTIKEVNGTAITAVGNNITVNNLNLPQHSGVAIDITGDDATVTNIDSSIADGDIIVNGAINIDVNVDDVMYPDAAVVIVNAGVDGTYIARVNGKNYNVTVRNGTGSSVLDVLPAEIYDVVVSGQFGADSPVSTDSTSFSVVDIVLPEIVANKTTDVLVDLPEDATGNVSVIVDGEVADSQELVNGSAVLEIPELKAGQHNITIRYAGNDEHNALNKTFDTIAKIDTETNITLPEILENKTTKIPVDLPEDATGNVSVIVDGEVADSQELVNGLAVLEIPELEAGQHNISIVYPGDDKYASFNQTSDVPVKVDTDANITLPEILENETTTIPVDLPEDATGNISVIVDDEVVDSQELVNGSAVLEIPELEAGHHNISIVYPGDDKYASINQTSDVLVKVDGEFNVTEPKVYENQTTEIPVELPEDATGNVSVMVDGEIIDTRELVNGSAILEIPALSKENHTISVTYTGDDKYASQNIEFNVSVLDDVIITANDLVKYYSAPDKFEINLTDSKGNPLTNKSVNITVNGVSYSRTTNENGSAYLNIRLRPGEYEAVVSTDNVTLNQNITVLSTINGTDIVKIFRNGTQYYVTIKGADGSYLPEGSKVEFNINGVLYNRTVKGDEGLVKLNINLDEGEYIVTATNLETNESVSNTITVLSRISSEDITKYFRNNTQYEVTLLDDNGNPVGAGVSVTFNVNGIFYTRYTNDEGVAKLNINLPPGDWIVTADCNGCLASNNIKVLPVLTADNLVKQQGTDTPFVATLLNGQGQPYENQKVTFNINGVFDESTTDANGQAKLAVNLPNGKYIVTSSYNGCSISNNLTITN